MKNELSIPMDKNYYKKMSFLMPLIVLMGANRAWNSLQSGDSLLSMNLWLLMTLISLVIMVRVLLKTFDARPAFLLNKDGLVDNVSITKAGFISWDQILGSEVKDYAGAEQFILKVRDPEKYTEGLKYFNRQMANQMITDEGSPIIVNTRFLKYPSKKLVEVINRSAKVGRLKV